MPTGNLTKGLRFLSKNKAVVDLNRHDDIMEDVIDRITIKEAMQKRDFVSWNEVEKKVNKKLGIHHGIHGTTNQAGRKKSTKSKIRIIYATSEITSVVYRMSRARRMC